MKAIIVEIKGKDAIVLDKKGQFIKIKNRDHYKVGCEIDVQANGVHQYSKWMKPASIAAAFIMVIGLSFGIYSYAAPYSYIDLDINPSVELTTNRFDKVLKVEALNDDAKKLVDGLRWKNQEVEEVVNLILKDAIDKGYLKQNEDNAVVLSLVSDDEQKSELLEKKITQSTKHELEDANVKSEVYVHKANLKTRNEARNLGLTTGKLRLVQKLEDIDPKTDVKAAKLLPVKKIVETINEKRKIWKEKNKDVITEDFKDYQEELDSDKDNKTEVKNPKSNSNKEDKVKNKTIIKEIKDKEEKVNNSQKDKKVDNDKHPKNNTVRETSNAQNKDINKNKNKDEGKGKSNSNSNDKKRNSIIEDKGVKTNVHKNSVGDEKYKEQTRQKVQEKLEPKKENQIKVSENQKGNE